MVIENLTQGSHLFKQEMNHLLVVREYLQNCPLSGQYLGKDGCGCKDAGSIRDISHWLDKSTGDVMKLNWMYYYMILGFVIIGILAIIRFITSN